MMIGCSLGQIGLQNGKATAYLERGELPRKDVEDFQRTRIIGAMVEISSETGYIGAAVAPVLARAGVSRRTFYELFDGREECFIAAFDWGVERAQEAIVEAYTSQRSWRERIRHALAALLVLLDCEPEFARVCVIESLAAGKLALQRRAQVLEHLIDGLDAEAPRAHSAKDKPAAQHKPLLTAEGVIGGAFSVIHGRLLERRIAEETRDSGARGTPHRPGADNDNRSPGPLIELHGQLMALIALPYLGPSAAGEELTRTAPERPRHELHRTLTPHRKQVLGAVRGR